MRDDVKAFVRNMRICCGDVQLGDEDECAVFCANPRDVRDGEARFCRQWLVKDAADLIESLAAELERVERERDAAVEDLRKVCQATEVCFCCKSHNTNYTEYVSNDCMDCIRHCNWQWRGVKEG